VFLSDVFLMVLFRLRTGVSNKIAAFLFGFAETSARRHFVRGLVALRDALAEVQPPPKDLAAAPVPPEWAAIVGPEANSVFMVIDATEFKYAVCLLYWGS